MWLELENIHRHFGSRKAVDGLSLGLDRGAIGCLLGPSGCGKTTALRCIAGFDPVTEGEIRAHGRVLSKPGAIEPPETRRIGMVFQDFALFPHLTVADNVAFGLHRMRADERARRTAGMLEAVSLGEYRDQYPHQLSGGQQQRVALARALANGPRVLLLDEPLGALDLKLRKEMQVFLKRLQQELGVTFVHVTHDQEEALALADRVAVMNRGRIEQLGSPLEVYDKPATRFVADFIGETNFVRRNGSVLALRPERLELHSDGNGAGDGLAGEIVTTMVIGPAIQSLVRADDGQEVLVRQQRGDGGTASFQEGERVVVTWAEGAALVFTEEEQEAR
jgi:ABC-type Fe3+/spermidine/putrescine transport system ATPase subunit